MLSLDDCKEIGTLHEIHKAEVARGFCEEPLVIALGQALALLDKVIEDEGSAPTGR